MKLFEQPDGLEGYVVLVEEEDVKTPLDLPELKGDWVDIINRCEGVTKKDGHYHAVYLTNNEFAIEFLIPAKDWLPDDIRKALEDAAGAVSYKNRRQHHDNKEN